MTALVITTQRHRYLEDDVNDSMNSLCVFAYKRACLLH